ncbi:MAG: hypothetical protein QOK17_793 [Sphingomonadales bacterium]|jgi:hypothetical protein|nr:hypothetical protein [Sphingomonadales bacterium]
MTLVQTTLLIVGVTYFLTGCQKTYPDLPNIDDVENIERLLDHVPCYSPLDKWFREYLFARRGDHLDKKWIYFSFYQAGIYGYRAGRARIKLGNTFKFDDRPYDVASGRYEVATHRLILDYCGPNFPKR